MHMAPAFSDSRSCIALPDDSPQMPLLTHIDCFAGPGGICTGFRAAGIRTVMAIEQIQSCVDTYFRNHPYVTIFNKDIRNVTREDILSAMPSTEIDIVTSGMPCETFSTAGNKSRSFYDDRQFLFREGLRVANIAGARFILFENVPAITSKRVSKEKPDLIIDLLERELKDAGFVNQARFLLNASDYGVPQRRKRFFILAARDCSIHLSAPLPTCDKTVTVADAFAGLPDVVPNICHEPNYYLPEDTAYSRLMRDLSFWKTGIGMNKVLSYQTPMRHRNCTIERFSLLQGGESLKNLFEKFSDAERKELQSRRVLPKKVYIQRNYRLKNNDVSPTVTSHCLDEFVHPVSDRALTVRECARLQSFPDCYDFVGGPFIVPHINKSVQDKYEQIGDAVPPLLAYAWGRHLVKLLAEHTFPLLKRVSPFDK